MGWENQPRGDGDTPITEELGGVGRRRVLELAGVGALSTALPSVANTAAGDPDRDGEEFTGDDGAGTSSIGGPADFADGIVAEDDETEPILDDVVDVRFSGNLAQAGVFVDTPLAGFPLGGRTYGVLTTGVASGVPGSPDEFESVFYSFSPDGVAPNGVPAYDVVSVAFDIAVPENAREVRFDYKFASEEIPAFVGSLFQDYFTATLEYPDGTAENVATIGGDPVTVDTVAPIAETFPNVVYNGVSPALTARGDLTDYRGETVTLRLTLGDAGDPFYDSAVFLDNFAFGVEPQVSVQRQRLVQTVENTRLVESLGADTYADDRIDTRNEDAPDTPDADLVYGRATSSVFDIDVDDPSEFAEPVDVTVTRELATGGTEERSFVVGDDTVREVAGDDGTLLGRLADGSALTDGEFPVFDLSEDLASVTVDLEPRSEDYAGDSSSLEFPSDLRGGVDPVETEELTVGFIPVVNRDLPYGTIAQDDDTVRAFRAYTEFVVQGLEYMQRIYPTTAINAYKQNISTPIIGNTLESIGGGRVTRSNWAQVDAAKARQELDGQLPVSTDDPPGDGEIIRATDGSVTRFPSGDVTIEDFDVTLAITPDGYLNYNGISFGGGVHFFYYSPFAEDPTAQPSISAHVEFPPGSDVDLDDLDATNVAHEAGHHFISHQYDDDMQQDPGDNGHPNERLISTKYDLEGGEFSVDANEPSFMSYQRPRWMDSFSCQFLIDDGFTPRPGEGSPIDAVVRGVFATGSIEEDGVEITSLQDRQLRTVTDVSDGRGEVTVLGPGDTTLETQSIPTGLEYPAAGSADDGSPRRVRDVVVAAIPFPERTVAIRFTVPATDGDGTVTTEVAPLTRSLRGLVGAVPDEGVVAEASGIKTALGNRLDAIDGHVDHGRFRSALNVMESVRRTLDRQLVDGYDTRRAGQPTKAELLATVDDRLGRLETLAGTGQSSGDGN